MPPPVDYYRLPAWILEAVAAERRRQAEELGYDAAHDAHHTADEWVVTLTVLLGRFATATCYQEADRFDWDAGRTALIKLIAVAQAALEANPPD